MSKPYNPQAFPNPILVLGDIDSSKVDNVKKGFERILKSQDGKTLLDYFAEGQAKLTFNDKIYWKYVASHTEGYAEQEAASRAFGRAEAMLAEREKRLNES